jgi:hypothetical protein
LAAKAAVGPVIVLAVLPFLEFLVEKTGVVFDDTVEESVPQPSVRAQ